MEFCDPSLTHCKSHQVDYFNIEEAQTVLPMLKKALRQVLYPSLCAMFTPAVWVTVVTDRKLWLIDLYGEVTSNRFQRLNNFHHNERGVRRNERDRERGGSLEHHVDYYNEKERERKRERWSEDSVKSPLWTQQCGRWPSCHRKTPGLLIKWQGGW